MNYEAEEKSKFYTISYVGKKIIYKVVEITLKKNGELDGLWEMFHKNGQLREKRNYKNREYDGLWEYFDEDGNLISKKCFTNNKEVRMSKCEN